MGSYAVGCSEMALFAFNTLLQFGRNGNIGKCRGLSKFLKEQNRCVCSGEVMMSTDVATSVETDNKAAKMSKAMKAYMERTVAHNEFMKEQIAEFEIGKRHLANMMGEDPETFTQEDIDKAIQYLFPSGLFEPKARPMMKHPDQVFAKRK